MPASEPAALEISEYENASDHGHPLSQRHVLKRMYGSREERLQLLQTLKSSFEVEQTPMF